MTVIKMPRVEALMRLGKFVAADGALNLGRGVLAYSSQAAQGVLDKMESLLENEIIQATPKLQIQLLRGMAEASRAIGQQGVALLESVKLSPPEQVARPVAPAFGPDQPLVINNQAGGTVQVAAITPKSGVTS